jgi:glycosyltransferase involved in cell wall biosynthesis
MKIVIFPRYDESQAATRVRVIQYLPYLSDAGIDVEVFPILSSEGISGRSRLIPFIISRIESYLRVSRKLFKEKGNDSIIHIHSELFPFVPFWIEFGYLYFFGKKKFIIELDDAWFHRYDAHKYLIVRLLLGGKIRRLMNRSSLLIAGNQYIADYGKAAGAKYIEIIPTVVDVDRYKKYQISKESPDNSEINQILDFSPKKENEITKPVIGWIGSPATTKFLLSISDIIKTIDHDGIASFVAIGADYQQVKMLPIKVIPWCEQKEIELLNQFDIGIMPLIDSLFERGKCGFKIIQYMASGLPVVASPVGANESIVLPNVTGFLAKTEDDWFKYLSELCKDSKLRHLMGVEGLNRADNLYSLRVTYPRLVAALKNVLKS